MADPEERNRVRDIVGAELSDEQADALVATSAALSRNVASMPRSELRQMEPPLRSLPAPRRP